MEQEHDAVVLVGLQRALALQEAEVALVEKRHADELSRYEGHKKTIQDQHEQTLASINDHRQQALAERERVSAQVSELAQRIVP